MADSQQCKWSGHAVGNEIDLVWTVVTLPAGSWRLLKDVASWSPTGGELGADSRHPGVTSDGWISTELRSPSEAEHRLLLRPTQRQLDALNPHLGGEVNRVGASVDHKGINAISSYALIEL